MVLVNGVATHVVGAADRGFAFGDGLFETLAVVDRRILNWSAHYERLRHGCSALGIALIYLQVHRVVARADAADDRVSILLAGLLLVAAARKRSVDGRSIIGR